MDISKFTRNEVVPLYVDLICKEATQAEIIELNQAIIKKWSNSALIYIKEKAWRYVRLHID